MENVLIYTRVQLEALAKHSRRKHLKKKKMVIGTKKEEKIRLYMDLGTCFVDSNYHNCCSSYFRNSFSRNFSTRNLKMKFEIRIFILMM